MAIEIEQPSVGLSKVAVSETHGEDSPYFAGWKAYDEDPYDESSNPSGVIQMGLAENQVIKDKYFMKEEIWYSHHTTCTYKLFFLYRFHLICWKNTWKSILKRLHGERELQASEKMPCFRTTMASKVSDKQWLVSWNRLEVEEPSLTLIE